MVVPLGFCKGVLVRFYTLDLSSSCVISCMQSNPRQTTMELQSQTSSLSFLHISAHLRARGTFLRPRPFLSTFDLFRGAFSHSEPSHASEVNYSCSGQSFSPRPSNNPQLFSQKPKYTSFLLLEEKKASVFFSFGWAGSCLQDV